MAAEINQIFTITPSRRSLRLLVNHELNKVNENFIDLNNSKIESIAITPGSDIAITGSGTDIDPYVIHFTGVWGEQGILNASDINITPIDGLTATNLQEAIEELLMKMTVIDGGGA